MKRFLFGLVMTIGLIGQVLLPHAAEARSYRTRSSDVYVRGYYRSGGTYVQPYYRSRADGYKFNNYGCIDYGRC